MQMKELKAKAHKLEPVVIIGAKGLTEEVLAEIERALKAHELVKVRAPVLERSERNQVLIQVCERTGAQPVQQVGKVFVIYRKNTSEARNNP